MKDITTPQRPGASSAVGILRAALIVSLLVVAPAVSGAQTAPDPSGHWVGTVSVPTMPIDIEIDIARSPSGELSGTLSIPSQKLLGLPLSRIAANGAAIAFAARVDQGFSGTLSPDGMTMSGDFAIQVFNLPFMLTRTGPAKVDPPPTSPPVSKDLEGIWNGTLAANGNQMRVVLKFANHPDGTSTGTLINLDEGLLELPIATITQKGAAVTLGFKVVDGSYVGVLDATSGELTGTWTQGTLSGLITFRRAVKADTPPSVP